MTKNPTATMEPVAALQRDAQVVEKRLETLVQGGPALLQEAMRYAVLEGGKRLRPILCMWTAELLGSKDTHLALDVGCAVELIHCYSLVHDDLPCMDDDAMRRGRPTVHVKYGEAMAVLVGDALQSLAFTTLLNAPWPNAAVAQSAGLELSVTAGPSHLVGGQVLDLQAAGKTDDAPPVLEIHLAKTAALLRCSMVLGAQVARASEEDVQQVAKVGSDLGLAFQIIDDLLDGSASSDDLGKTAGKDQKSGKVTWPAVYGEAASKVHAGKLVAQAVAALEGWPEHQKLVWLAHLFEQRLV
jgi:geranylgeranyl pyrophosphate synthase